MHPSLRGSSKNFMRFLPKSTLRLVAKDMKPAAGATTLATLFWMMTVIVAFPNVC